MLLYLLNDHLREVVFSVRLGFQGRFKTDGGRMRQLKIVLYGQSGHGSCLSGKYEATARNSYRSSIYE